MAKKYLCPSCKTSLMERGDFFPFCSERCKLQDLGAWASGKYAIPGEEIPTEELPLEEQSTELPPLKRRNVN